MRGGFSATNPVWGRPCRHRRPPGGSARGEPPLMPVGASVHDPHLADRPSRPSESFDPPIARIVLGPPRSIVQPRRQSDETDAVPPLGCPSPAISRFPSYRQSPEAMSALAAGSGCDRPAKPNGRDCVDALCSSRQPVFLSVSMNLIPDRGRDCVAGWCSNRRNTVCRTVNPLCFQRWGRRWRARNDSNVRPSDS